MDVRPPARSRRWLRMLSRLALAAALIGGATLIYGLTHPDEVLGLRVSRALTAAGLSTLGTEIVVDGQEVRLQGFVHSAGARTRMVDPRHPLQRVPTAIARWLGAAARL